MARLNWESPGAVAESILKAAIAGKFDRNDVASAELSGAHSRGVMRMELRGEGGRGFSLSMQKPAGLPPSFKIGRNTHVDFHPEDWTALRTMGLGAIEAGGFHNLLFPKSLFDAWKARGYDIRYDETLGKAVAVVPRNEAKGVSSVAHFGDWSDFCSRFKEWLPFIAGVKGKTHEEFIRKAHFPPGKESFESYYSDKGRFIPRFYGLLMEASAGSKRGRSLFNAGEMPDAHRQRIARLIRREFRLSNNELALRHLDGIIHSINFVERSGKLGRMEAELAVRTENWPHFPSKKGGLKPVKPRGRARS